MEVPEAETSRYGIVAGAPLGPELLRVQAIVEKPAPGTAPSRLAAIGRYILPPSIIPILEKLPPGAQGEIQLSDAIAALAIAEPVYALSQPCERYDCGQLAGWLSANLHLALRREELKAAVLEVLARLR